MDTVVTTLAPSFLIGSSSVVQNAEAVMNGINNVAYHISSEDIGVAVTPTSGVAPDLQLRKGKKGQKGAKHTFTVDKRFGYGSFKPECLQFLNKIWVLVVWLFLFNFLEGFSVNGLTPAALPSIERQFQLTSTKSSIIPASHDIGALALILFISFISGRTNKITWIASGSLMLALGSVLFIVPHIATEYQFQGKASHDIGALALILFISFISGRTNKITWIASGSPMLALGSLLFIVPQIATEYQYQGKDVMEDTGPNNPCADTVKSKSLSDESCYGSGEQYITVFVVAQIINGLGYCTMFTLGAVYLYENSDPNTAGLYLGICAAASAIGLAAGYLVGGQLIEQFFVEFDRVDQDMLGFGPRDTRWVGAWWMGFGFTAVAFVFVSIPLFGYPKYMPGNGTAEEREKKLKNEPDITCGNLVQHVILPFLNAFLKLLKNPTYVFIQLAQVSQAMVIFGVSAFAYKYLLEMYNLTFDRTGLLLGGLIVVGSLGMFLGGFLIRVFKLEVAGMLRLCSTVTCLSAVLGLSFLAKCPETNLASLRMTYPGESMIIGYTASCSAECSCDEQKFNPVCGADGFVYYSACHAGCTTQSNTSMGSFSHCNCAAASFNVSINSNATATSGRCPDGCTNIDILVPCLFIMMILSLMSSVPSGMAVLGSVEEDIRPFALGLSSVCDRLLGSIPGPVILGSVIDGACILWEVSTCGDSVLCMLYNKERLSLSFTLWWTLFSGLASFFFLIASFMSSCRGKGSLDVTT